MNALPEADWLDRAERTLAKLGAVALAWGSPGYPARLTELADAPPVLSVRGDPGALAQTAVAIVGSRAASGYGLEVARQVAGELAAAGVVVVSGLAFGIDAAAHEAALEAGGRTRSRRHCAPGSARAICSRV